MIENAIYGLVGEFGEVVDLLKKAKFQGHELDREKAILELGDVLWYLAELATGASLDLYKYYEYHEKNIYKDWSDAIPMINVFSKDVSGLADIFYFLRRIRIQYEDVGPIYGILEVITSLCRMFDTTIDEVAEKNIEKLRKRYGEKFDSLKSINRSE